MENNGVMKHLERFRKVIRLGVKLGWIDKNPFELFKLKLQKVERGYLKGLGGKIETKSPPERPKTDIYNRT